MSRRRPQAIRIRVLQRRQTFRRSTLLFLLLMVALLVGPGAVSAMETRQQRPSGTAELATVTPSDAASTTAAPIDESARLQTQPGPDSPPRPDRVRSEPWSAWGQPERAAALAPKAPGASRPLSLYQQAGQRYGLNPALLRALHQVESSGAMGGCVRNRQGSGALGPFQFMPRTFWQYAVDADGDARPDICSFADSLFTAARYLKALGADADPRSGATEYALQRYGTDSGQVIALANSR